MPDYGHLATQTDILQPGLYIKKNLYTGHTHHRPILYLQKR